MAKREIVMRTTRWGFAKRSGRPVSCLLQGGFTLIELLVVIAIIALLAAMIFPVTWIVNKQKILSVSKAGRSQMELLIESYHSKVGSYPPADTNNPALNPLYYELGGATLDSSGWVTSAADGLIAPEVRTTACRPPVVGSSSSAPYTCF